MTRILLCIWLYFVALLGLWVSAQNCYEEAAFGHCWEERQWPKAHCSQKDLYWDCLNGAVRIQRCPADLTYQSAIGGCRTSDSPTSRYKRQGRGIVGTSCQSNLDCDANLRLFCTGGLCACSYGFVQSSRDSDRCLPQKDNSGRKLEIIRQPFQRLKLKVNPGQRTCAENIQCSSVWAGARCVSGACQCSDPAEYVAATRDGAVCVRGPGASCPLPTGLEVDGVTPQGATSVLYQPGSTAQVTCSNSPLNPNAFIACAVAGQPGIAGLYDCIPTSDGTTGRCCPNRALTCMLPRNSGNGGGNFQRWWYGQGVCSFAENRVREMFPRYNTVTDSCESFLYRGRGVNGPFPSGNSNNFADRNSCESYCRNRCTRGQPAYTGGTGPTSRPSSCSASSGCSGANFECQTPVDGNPNAGNQGCPCPNGYACTNNVCCPNQQRTCNAPVDVGFNSCAGGNSFTTRYAYESRTGRCRSFTYSGCGGNGNNFESLNECETACSTVSTIPQCPQGEALSRGTNTNGATNYLTCSGSGTCSSNYECIDGGCCPTRPFTCALAPSPGTTCGRASTRYYFDGTDGICKTFNYLGCDGNSNNFGTPEACRDYCGGGGCPNGGDSVSATGNAVSCLIGGTNCPSDYVCTAVNSFNRNTGTINRCCPSRARICSLPVNSGDSSCGAGNSRRYYFDTSAGVRACRAFFFNGCGGNDNNFPSASECNNFCSSAACPAGQRALGSSTCTINSDTCPNGFTCLRDTLFNRNVCCGATDEGVCPEGNAAYIDPTTAVPQRCQPGRLSSCPLDYFCRLDTRSFPNGQYVCCRPSSFCPSGFLPALQTTFSVGATVGLSRPIACFINGGLGSVNSGISTFCQSGFSCQASVPGSPTGYCCSTGRICALGLEVYKDSNGNYPTCNRGFGNGGCPNGYACSNQQGTSGFSYCCGLGSSGNRFCGSGRGSALIDAGGVPRQCRPGNTSPCPVGYSCTQGTSGLYYCCSGISGVCGGGTAFIRNGQIQLCTKLGDPICPSGYTCTLNANNNQFYCCSGTGSGCPAPGVAQVVNGGSVACNPRLNSNQCIVGYSCVGSGSTGLCCSSISATVCGAGFDVYQPGGVPIACDINDNRCGAGQVCKEYVSSGLRLAYCCLPRSADLCPTGTAFRDGLVTRICSPGVVNTCPINYACTLSSNSGYVCCPSAVTGVCPNGAVLQSRVCSPQVAASCPGGICTLIAATGRYQCCGGTNNGNLPVGLACPSGGTSTALPCTAGSGSRECGSGSTCQLVSGRYVCCSGVVVTPLACPQGGTLQTTTSCTGPGSNCGVGNSCQLIAALGVGQYRCCNGVGQGTACSAGRVLVAPLTTCSPSPNTCALSQTCELVSGTYRCCRSNGSVNVPCPSGGFVIEPRRPCSPSLVNSGCLNGQSCQLVSNLYRCCLGGSSTNTGIIRTCTNGQPAYINPITQRNQACTGTAVSNTAACVAGYGCVAGLCCRDAIVNPIGDCPAGRRYLYTGRPLQCPLDGSLPCPSGYSCRRIPEIVNGRQGACCQNVFAADATDSSANDQKATRKVRLLSQKCGEESCPSGAECNDSVQQCECLEPSIAQNNTCVEPKSKNKSS